MFDLGDIGEKIGGLVSENLQSAAKENVENAIGENSDEFNKLVQDLIEKVSRKDWL